MFPDAMAVCSVQRPLLSVEACSQIERLGRLFDWPVLPRADPVEVGSGTVAQNPRSSSAPAAPPGRSSPSRPGRSCTSILHHPARSATMKQPRSQMGLWAQNRGQFKRACQAAYRAHTHSNSRDPTLWKPSPAGSRLARLPVGRRVGYPYPQAQRPLESGNHPRWRSRCGANRRG